MNYILDINSSKKINKQRMKMNKNLIVKNQYFCKIE